MSQTEENDNNRPAAETSIEHMAARGMIERLRCLADDMEETGDALQLCENNIDLAGAFSKGCEMKGAADMARKWSLHIESKYFSANAKAQG